MKELRNKHLLIFTMVMLLVGWGIWWVMNSAFHIEGFRGYPFIPVLFYLSGLVLVYVLFRVDKTKPRKLVNVYMLLKLIKMLVFGTTALIYLFAFKVNTKTFIVVFAFYYLIYLLFETYTFYSVEKQIKKQKA
ncbi:MAG: hypothetical protein LLF95_01865 [Bacteroidales bacterium]|nr:hypothetical protein [Bacteroidales bacterium]